MGRRGRLATLRVLALGVACGLLAAGAWAASKSAAAALTSARGQVVLTRAGRSLPALAPCKLLVGDSLTVGPRGEAVILYPSGQAKHVTATGQKVRVKIAAAPKAPAEGAAGRVWKYLSSRLGARGEESQSLVSREAATPVGLWPYDTPVRTPRPVFAWRVVEGAKYRVALLDAAAQEFWRSDLLAEPRLTYPEDAPALAPGQRYWWQVSAATEDDVATSPTYWLEVAPPEKAAAADALLAELEKTYQGEDQAALAGQKALLLASEGFRGEALAALAAAGDREPTDLELERWQQFLSRPE